MSLPDDSGGTGGSGSGTIGVTIFDISFVKHEAASVLRVLVYANLWSGDDLQLTANLSVDGSVQQSCNINLILDNTTSTARAPMTIPMFVTGLAAGTHRIVFSIHDLEPDSPLTVKAGATIEITELKQAAL